MVQLIIDNIVTDYEIDEAGNIFSKKSNKILSGHIENTGYKSVCLTVNKKKKNYAIHRLVAQTFIPNPDNLPIVNHKDGNKINNKIENLEWVNQSQNRQHAVETKISNLAYGKRQKIDNINEEDWKQYKDTNYYVSKDGAVWNSKTKCLLKQTPNQSGYIRYSLRINGKSVSKQAHILVIEVWKKQKILSGQVVNHIDGNKSNNNIDNLEIVSKKENALHACYVLNKNIKPVIQIDDDGIEKEYASLAKAARILDITPSAISFALKNNSKCCNSYWKYK